MQTIKLDHVLQKSLNNSQLIKLKTSTPDEDEYDGIVLHISKSVVTLHSVENFESDGILFIERKWISDYRDSEFEECFDKVMKYHHKIEKLHIVPWIIEIQTTKDVLLNCHKNSIWPLVETIDSDGETTSLYLGTITDVSGKSFSMYAYDATGNWEAEYDLPYKISLEWVSKTNTQPILMSI